MPAAAAAVTSSRNSSRKPNSCQVEYSCDSSSDMATMGPTSPTVPAARNMRPKLLSSCPASRSTGSSVPSAVVHSASVSISGARASGVS